MENESDIDNLARIIWNYHKLNQTLEKADAILVLGSHDLRVAKRAAQLYLDGWAPLVIFSGDRGILTKSFEKPEAEVFAEIAIKLGVPKDKIMFEGKSTNTGENIQFTKKLIAEKGLSINKIIAVQKPYMERRTYATLKKQWPEIDFTVSSQMVDFDNYFNDQYPRDYVINVMVGDLQRIKEYPRLGFQITQEIPEEVWRAYEKLVSLGYVKHLVK
jgi:uncharacterized SAM-binding protein YcdF (DUF218 family)